MSSTVYPRADALLERAKAAGIAAVVNICTDPDSLEKGLALRKRYPWVYNVAATTPHDVEKEGELYFETMSTHARAGDLVAVGETGLDYHYQHSPRELQQQFLRRYLRLALDCRLPLVVHCREAFADLFSILDREYVIEGQHAPGVLHCFTGSVEEADQLIARGWYLSLSGIVTFKKSQELREVARRAPSISCSSKPIRPIWRLKAIAESPMSPLSCPKQPLASLPSGPFLSKSLPKRPHPMPAHYLGYDEFFSSLREEKRRLILFPCAFMDKSPMKSLCVLCTFAPLR